MSLEADRMDGGFLGRRCSEAEITECDKAVLGLKTQRRKLTEQQRRAQNAMSELLEDARQGLRNKSRAQASFSLKRRKLVEKRLGAIDQLVVTVEEQLANLEQAKQQSVVIGALKQGTSALQEIQSKIMVEDIDKLIQETDAAQLTQKAINSKVYFECGDVGQELKMELEELEQVITDEEKLSLPAVPTTKPGEEAPWEVATGREGESTVGAGGGGGGGGGKKKKNTRKKRNQNELPCWHEHLFLFVIEFFSSRLMSLADTFF